MTIPLPAAGRIFWRASPVITRAIERGELPAGTDPAEILKILIARPCSGS